MLSINEKKSEIKTDIFFDLVPAFYEENCG